MTRRGWVIGLLLWLAWAAGAANVRAVQIQGLKRIGEAQLLRNLPIRVGKEFDQKDADAGRDWLIDRGLFLKVDLRVAAVGAVVDVFYTVVENPPVRTVMFKGNTQISGAALRADLITVPGEVLNRRNLWHDAGIIGAEYVKMGLHVSVETSFDPLPTNPDKPVAVTFTISELKFHALRCEPAGYVRPDKLAALAVLKPGELLRDERVLEQGRALDASGLFARLGDVDVKPVGEGDAADLVFPATESPRPLLTAENLPLVDLARLCQVVRLNAVAWEVDNADLEPWYPADTCVAKLTESRAALAAHPDDGEAAWQTALWTARSGAASRPALEAAKAVLDRAVAAGGTPRAHLRLGEVLHLLGEREQADKELSAAVADPAHKVEALKELLLVRSATARNQEGLDAVRRAVVDGADACAGLPDDADLEQLTSAFQFYYAALTVSGLNIGVKQVLR
ncbi:MAG: hypothetical protein HYU66_27715, partial [Armatimonadetes bacterium]|nr:hypothetical protein [Armatimonadota bacterium]